MLKKYLLSLSLVASLVSVQGAYALGMGGIQVKSYLEQPLDVRIQLIPEASDDIDSLRVNIASDVQFKGAGISKQDLYDKLRFEVVKGASPYVKISSRETLVEPFLHLLLEFTWNGGKILREYTALIDPPIYAAETNTVNQPSAPVTQEVFTVNEEADTSSFTSAYEQQYVGSTGVSAAANNSIESLPTAQTFPIDQVEETYIPSETYSTNTYIPSEVIVEESAFQYDSPIVETYESATSGATIGPVVAGDSLSMIAKSIQDQYPDLSIYQIMYVLFRDNKSAFIDDNINKLIKGSVLQASSIDEMRTIAKSDGQALFSSHLANLTIDDYSENPETDYQAPSTVSGVIDNASEAVNDVAEKVDSAEFKVGRTNVDSSEALQGLNEANSKVKALTSQLNEKEVDLETAKLENIELKERVSILQKQVKDSEELRELIALENESANELIEQIKQNEIAEAAAEAAKQTVAATTDSVENVVDSVKDAAEEAVNIETPQVDVPEVEVATPEVVVDKPIIFNKPETKLSFADRIKENLPLVGGGLAGLLALILGGIALSRRKSSSEFEDTMSGFSDMTPADNKLSPDTETVSADFKTTETTITKESSFLTVYSDSEVVVHADEIDPIAEADVYIAYGRDEQGEEVLLEGVRKFPNRPDIKLSLLKLYLKRKDVSKFDGIAENLYADGQQDNPDIWSKVVQMGSELSPENPMYQDTGSNAPIANLDSALEKQDSNIAKAAPVAASAAAIAAAANEAKSLLADDVAAIDDTLEITSLDNELDVDLDFDKVDDVINVEDTVLDLDTDLSDEISFDIDVADSELLDNSVTETIDLDLDGDVDIELNEIGQTIDIEANDVDKNIDDNTIDISIDDSLDVLTKEPDVGRVAKVGDELADVMDFEEYKEEDSVLDIEVLDASAEAESLNVDSIIDDINTEVSGLDDVDVADVNVEIEDIVDITLTPEPEVKGPGVDFDEPLSIQLEDVSLDITPQGELADPATQLELAKVFIELDDMSGAKEILDTLVDVKEDGIKSEVTRLLKSIKS